MKKFIIEKLELKIINDLSYGQIYISKMFKGFLFFINNDNPDYLNVRYTIKTESEKYGYECTLFYRVILDLTIEDLKRYVFNEMKEKTINKFLENEKIN